MKEYVSGALLNREGSKIALIQKRRPKWQEGYFNLIGGKIETTDCSPSHAMRREAHEEANLDLEWDYCFSYDEHGFIIHFFKCYTDQIYSLKSMTDEKIEIFNLDDLPENLASDLKGFLARILDTNK